MRILIADDDEISRKLLEANLRNWEYDVLAANDGEQALSLFAENPGITLAIMDWMMPKLDGLEVCREIKRRAENGFIYVIVLTAKAESNDIVQAFAAGADDFIAKPFNKNELRARVSAGVRVINLKDILVNKIRELEDAVSHVKKLQGILPICSWCKKIRNDSDYWQSVEEYLGAYGNPQFTHSICPACMEKHYPEDATVPGETAAHNRGDEA